MMMAQKQPVIKPLIAIGLPVCILVTICCKLAFAFIITPPPQPPPPCPPNPILTRDWQCCVPADFQGPPSLLANCVLDDPPLNPCKVAENMTCDSTELQQLVAHGYCRELAEEEGNEGEGLPPYTQCVINCSIYDLKVYKYHCFYVPPLFIIPEFCACLAEVMVPQPPNPVQMQVYDCDPNCDKCP
jgi:hypothetical protein